MDLFWHYLYNIVVVPLFRLLLLLASFFNKKIKRGKDGRQRLFEELIINGSGLNKKRRMIWFHSSSMGEFEQAKPIIERLKKETNLNILVTFFSPSGYDNSKKYPYADLISYIPIDTKSNAGKFIELSRPSLVVLMRYDIWPNYVRLLFQQHIPILLVDATMRDSSFRLLPIAKSFHKNLFSKLSHILTVSENDAKNFKSILSDSEQNKISVVGDTRFDRVYQKSLVAKERNLLRENITLGKKVFVAGSTWEEDEEILIPCLKKILPYEKDLLIILVPHEPSETHLERLENEFSTVEKTIRFSFLNNYSGERVILVDSIGILLTLYYYASLAFVGGSFKSSIHNVLEAAVYGIPVMFGPKIQTSQESQELVRLGGGILVKDVKECYRQLRRLIANEEERLHKGKISKEYVETNLGSTDKILKVIKSYI